ncbi:MAG: dihydrodipicolinate synthase family protein [Paracoccus aminovorans]|nr:dihydrodipicolinate synthase family protein [Paracoccus aminovorans]
MSFAFPGLNLAVTTPFAEDGSIAFDRLEAHLERYLAAGIPGFVLSSGTGLHAYLSRAESDELVARGARIIDGRARVIVQTSALMVQDVVERSRHAADHGADGVMLLPPFFEGPTDDDDVVAFYQAAAQGGLPIIGYNVPHVTGVAVTPELFRRLAEIPNFVTVKDSSGDLVQQTELIRTGLPMMNGADPLVPYALLAGVQGLIWGGANFAPKACVAVVKAAEAGDWSKMRELWRVLEPAMNLIWQGDYGQSVYAAAEMTGYAAGNPRRPFSPLSTDKREALRAALGGLIDSEARS